MGCWHCSHAFWQHLPYIWLALTGKTNRQNILKSLWFADIVVALSDHISLTYDWQSLEKLKGKIFWKIWVSCGHAFLTTLSLCMTGSHWKCPKSTYSEKSVGCLWSLSGGINLTLTLWLAVTGKTNRQNILKGLWVAGTVVTLSDSICLTYDWQSFEKPKGKIFWKVCGLPAVTLSGEINLTYVWQWLEKPTGKIFWKVYVSLVLSSRILTTLALRDYDWQSLEKPTAKIVWKVYGLFVVLLSGEITLMCDGQSLEKPEGKIFGKNQRVACGHAFWPH